MWTRSLFEANPEDPDQYGVDIKGTAYSIDLREVQVLYPTDLNQLLFRANVSHLLLRSRTRSQHFETFAAASGPGGQQDVCASTTELALALWNGPGESVIEGGRFHHWRNGRPIVRASMQPFLTVATGHP